MIISIEEARDILRIDENYLDGIIIPLLDAIPSYLEITTGKAWDTDPVNPLAKTAAGFILQLWYEPQDESIDRLKKTIDGFLALLTTIGRE